MAEYETVIRNTTIATASDVVKGDIGVLGGHSPGIVTLRGGTIQLFEGDKVSETLFVTGGFAEIATERCTVLATEVMAMADVSKAEGEKRLAAAEAAYEDAAKAGPDAEDAATIKVVKKVMEDAPHPAVQLAVPLQVDARAAKNWDEAH